MIFVARRGPVAGCQNYCVGEKGGVRCARNMRPIGQLETEEQARVFADYLYVRDIAAEVEDLAGEAWRVWVVDEDRVDEGRALLSRFLSMPAAEEFYRAQDAAKERRREEQQAAAVPDTQLRAQRQRARVARGRGTFGVIGICLVVGLFSRLGAETEWVRWLNLAAAGPAGDWLSAGALWQALAGGQIWRLITPVFLHYSLWQLLINVLWLQELGGVLEARLGTRHLLLLLGLLAVATNLAQYAAVGGALMGMNGVVYGMLGYYGVRQRLTGWTYPVISPVTYGVLLVFLGLGVFGLLGPAANAAHFTGLLTGAAAGWVAAKKGR